MLSETKIGDQVILVAPSGNTRTVVVTDVIRDPFDHTSVLAIVFKGINGPTTLSAKFFRSKEE